mgnify:CR=1 FL=1
MIKFYLKQITFIKLSKIITGKLSQNSHTFSCLKNFLK